MDDLFERISGWLLGVIAFIVTGWVEMVRRWHSKRFTELEAGHKELSDQLGHHNDVLVDHDKRMDISKVYMTQVQSDITEIKTNLKESSETINTKLDKIMNGN